MEEDIAKKINLPGIMVEYSIETSETIFLWVRVEKKRAICPRCGVSSHSLHQNKRHNIRDLPISNREVILKVNRRQFKCEKCKKPFSETLDFLESRKRFTKRYAVRITEQVISSDVKNVAEITVDRFHVTKMVHEELNQARIEEKKTAETLKVKERAKLFTSLKGSKYTLLKRVDKLSTQQKEKLEQVKGASPLIEIMHSLKEEFTNIFDESENLGEGKLKLIDWQKKAEKYYKNIVQTIKRWFPEIVGYFESKTTSGIVEGINNKLTSTFINERALDFQDSCYKIGDRTIPLAYLSVNAIISTNF